MLKNVTSAAVQFRCKLIRIPLCSPFRPQVTDFFNTLLGPIWYTTAETASRVRGRIERVLAWATVAGYRTGDNPARWTGHLRELLPPKAKVAAVVHHDAIPYRDMPAFMATLRAKKGPSARALEFAILTAAQTGEVIGAKWEEFDFEANVWVVPAERMKAAREHRVPLSDGALTILKSLPRAHAIGNKVEAAYRRGDMMESAAG